ncbi:MAG TPA: hypothetical protein VGM88_02950 [Kofleriaceae bacterium]|jgi:hypothetical protein
MPPVFVENVDAYDAREHALNSFLVSRRERPRHARYQRRRDELMMLLREQLDSIGRQRFDELLSLKNENEGKLCEAVYDYAFQLGREAGAIERLPVLRRGAKRGCKTTKKAGRERATGRAAPSGR